MARGAANSKGSLASFLLALASARRVSDLPAEIVFLVDGEEELGSPNLPDVMSDRRADLAAEAAFDMDLTADRRDVSEVYLGCKGIVSFVLSCSGGEWGGPVGQGAPLQRGGGDLLPRLVPGARPDRADRTPPSETLSTASGRRRFPRRTRNCSTPWRESSTRPRIWRNRARWRTGDRTTRVRF